MGVTCTTIYIYILNNFIVKGTFFIPELFVHFELIIAWAITLAIAHDLNLYYNISIVIDNKIYCVICWDNESF